MYDSSLILHVKSKLSSPKLISTSKINTKLLLLQIATNTSFSRCGKSAGTRRRWSTTCGSANAGPWSPGAPRPWPRPSSPCSKRDSPYHRQPENTIFRTRRSCSTPTESTICWAPALTAAQVCQAIVLFQSSDYWRKPLVVYTVLHKSPHYNVDHNFN